MKTILILFLTLISLNVNSQIAPASDSSENAGLKIIFKYDSAGNQIKREAIVINNRMSKAAPAKQIKDLTSSDLKTSDVSDEIKYYPNPVQEDLFIKWIETNNKKVVDLQLFDLSGQLLKTFSNFNGNNTMTINFQEFPAGYFNLILNYDTSEKKILKILKQ